MYIYKFYYYILLLLVKVTEKYYLTEGQYREKKRLLS